MSKELSWVVGLLCDQGEMYRKMMECHTPGDMFHVINRVRMELCNILVGAIKTHPMDEDAVGKYERQCFNDSVQRVREEIQEQSGPREPHVPESRET